LQTNFRLKYLQFLHLSFLDSFEANCRTSWWFICASPYYFSTYSFFLVLNAKSMKHSVLLLPFCCITLFSWLGHGCLLKPLFCFVLSFCQTEALVEAAIFGSLVFYATVSTVESAPKWVWCSV